MNLFFLLSILLTTSCGIREYCNNALNNIKTYISQTNNQNIESLDIDEKGLDYSTIFNLARVIGTVKHHYSKEKKSNEEIFEAAVEGIMNKLEDPYSNFIPGEELKDLCSEYIEGSFDGGIGVMMLKFKNSEAILVVQVMEGSSAEKAGLKKGDKIVKVNGRSIEGVSSKDCVAKIKGKMGTSVNLRIKRKDKFFDVKVRRSRIEIDNVRGRMVREDIGLIQLDKFSANVVEKTRKILNNLRSKGAKYIILDLRDNPGGTLDDAVGIASIFTSKSPIAGQKSNFEKKMFERVGEYDESFPLVLLINGGSASGSEVVASCLKSHGRALLIGERTYGKGTVQVVSAIDSENVEKGAIKLTIANFFGPKEEVIDKEGVSPHIYVGQDSSTMRIILDEESKSLVKFEDFYIDMLEKVDYQKEIQMDTAINIIKALKGDFSEFMEDSNAKK